LESLWRQWYLPGSFS